MLTVVMVFMVFAIFASDLSTVAQAESSRLTQSEVGVMMRMREDPVLFPLGREFVERLREHCRQLNGRWDIASLRCRNVNVQQFMEQALARACAENHGLFEGGVCRVRVVYVYTPQEVCNILGGSWDGEFCFLGNQRICEELGGGRWCTSGLSEVGDQPQPLPADAIDAIQLTRGEIYYTRFAPGEAKLFVFRSASEEVYPNLAVGINTPSMYGDSQLIGLLARAGENCESPPFNPSDLLSVLRDLRRRWEAGQQDYLGRTEEGYYYAISNALVKNIWAREDAPFGTCWYLWVYNASPDRSFSSVRIGFTGPQD